MNPYHLKNSKLKEDLLILNGNLIILRDKNYSLKYTRGPLKAFESSRIVSSMDVTNDIRKEKGLSIYRPRVNLLANTSSSSSSENKPKIYTKSRRSNNKKSKNL